MPRIVPLTGTEAERATSAASVLAQEIHTTTDQKRVFLENKIVAPLWLGTVANEAAMLALSGGTFGCWPGDLCYRSDTGTAWRCIADNGEDLADWFELPKGASYTQGAAVANVDQTGFPANGTIAALTFSNPPTQAECQALRDQCEALRDTLAAAISTIDTLKGRFKVTGGNGLIAD
jgi:hypothetical protein